MNDIKDFVERSADQSGFKRVRFFEKKMPDRFEDIVVIPFFGDIKSTFVLSSFLLNQYKQKNPNKYIVLASWGGFENLFPYVDEYWTLKDTSATKQLSSTADYFANDSDLSTQIYRNLNRRFENVKMMEEWKEYYAEGFQDGFWKTFGEIRRFFPEVPSLSSVKSCIAVEMQKLEKRVVIFPVRRIRHRHRGKSEYLEVSGFFWSHLIQRLLNEGMKPIIYQNSFTYDLSKEFAEKCIYLNSDNISEVLSVFRHADCVVDIFSGVSRLAAAARAPFVCIDERARFMEEKEYEIDDLCCQKTPRKYIFSFSSVLLSDNTEQWNLSMLDNLVAKLNDFIGSIDRSSLESTQSWEEVISYDAVRKRRFRRFGVKFLRKH